MDVQVISPTKPSVVDIVESSDDDMVVSKKEEVKELVNRPEEKSVINDHVDNSLSTLEAKNVDPVATILDCSTDEELDFSRKINKENSVDTQVLNEGKKVLNDKLIYLNEDLSEIDKIKLKKNIANLKG